MIVRSYVDEKACRQVTNTSVELTQPLDDDDVWREAWTVEACGVTQAFDVRFTKSADGGPAILAWRSKLE